MFGSYIYKVFEGIWCIGHKTFKTFIINGVVIMEININDELANEYMKEKGINEFCLGVKVESLLSLHLKHGEEIDKITISNNKKQKRYEVIINEL